MVRIDPLKSFTVYCLVFLSLGIHPVFAEPEIAPPAKSKSTAEGRAVQIILFSIEEYRAVHAGQFPTNWDQLSESRDMDELDRSARVKELYVFIRDQRIPLPGDGKAEVFMIRTEPRGKSLWDSGERYIIARKDANFFSVLMPEDKVQKMLADAGVTKLPEPEPLVQSTNTTKPFTSTNRLIAPGMDASAQPVASAPTAIETNASGASSGSAPSASSWSSGWLLIVAVSAFVAGLFVILFRRKAKSGSQ